MRRTSTEFKPALGQKSKNRRSALCERPYADRHRSQRNDILPKLKLEVRSVDDLKRPVRRVRRASKAHVAEVREAIATLGFCKPMIVGADGVVVDGLAQLEAARELGLKQVPCIVVSHLKPEELKLLRLALNRLGEKGEWDLEELRLEIAELVEFEIDVEIAGFEPQEVDIILLNEVAEEPEQSPSLDTPPLPPECPVSQPGDFWRLGDHLIACGDARDRALLANLMTEPARLILSDPPFNVRIKDNVSGLGAKTHDEFVMASGEMTEAEFEAFLRAFINASSEHLMEGGLALIFMDWRGIETLLRAGREEGLSLLNIIVWAKSNGGMGSLWRSAHELIAAFKKGSAPHLNNVELGVHGRWRSNVWEASGASSAGSDARAGLHLHPTVKPVALLEDAILDVTARGEIVLDSFLGSGSTLIAAEKAGRRCRGVELDPSYVDVILLRWINHGGSAPVLIETGEPFNIVRERRMTSVLQLNSQGIETAAINSQCKK